MKRIRIYRNPRCERCARFAKLNTALDWLDRFEPSTATPPNGQRLRKGQIYIEDLRSHRQVRGDEAAALLCRQIPAYWPLLLLGWIPAVRRSLAAEMDAPGEEDCDLLSGAEKATP
jgi:hypothetical protein